MQIEEVRFTPTQLHLTISPLMELTIIVGPPDFNLTESPVLKLIL